MVGDGPLKNDMLKKSAHLHLEDRIKFLGNRSDISRILKIMDVFLFPSLYEGFPLSLIEAQMSGVKCIVSKNINQSVIVNNNVFQLELDEDINKWCYKIMDTDIQKEDCKIIKDKYSIKNVISELEYIYRKNLR